MDFYGGWKGSWGDWGLNVGGIYYYYPGGTKLRRRQQREHFLHLRQQLGGLSRRQLEVVLAEVLLLLHELLRPVAERDERALQSQQLARARPRPRAARSGYRRSARAACRRTATPRVRSTSWARSTTKSCPSSRSRRPPVTRGSATTASSTIFDFKVGATYDLAGWLLGAKHHRHRRRQAVLVRLQPGLRLRVEGPRDRFERPGAVGREDVLGPQSRAGSGRSVYPSVLTPS